MMMLVLPLVGACQLGLPQRDDAAPSAKADRSPLRPTLRRPDAVATAATAAGATPGTKATAVRATASATPRMSATALVQDAPATSAKTTDAALDAAAIAAAPPPPQPVKSPTQIACEKKGGHFTPTGANGTMTCVYQTRDAGKRCGKAGDCQGLCLARSRTCSPFTPVLGCQDILQQDGKLVTECVE